MCGALIPAILGVAALGMLGGVGGNCGNPCAVSGPSCGDTITIPQQVGDVTNGIPVSGGKQYAYAEMQSQYAAPAYGQPAYGQYGPAPQQYAPAPQPYGAENAPMGHYDPYGPAAANMGMGAGMNMDIGGATGADVGGYANPGGVGVGADVGGIGASVGVGARNY